MGQPPRLDLRPTPTRGPRLLFRAEPSFTVGSADLGLIVVALAWNVVDSFTPSVDVALDVALAFSGSGARQSQ